MSGAEVKIAVLGLGYVGLPLAVAFGDQHDTIGFDINAERVAELNRGEDRTLEVTSEELTGSKRLTLSSDPEVLKTCNVFVVTVPTPIDAHKRPDLGALLAASRTVGAAISKGGIVVYESTVYPGATEEDCIPVV
ncbi:MAG: Vi polysaccharide biosynthesis UDP-N-acetylglucosamine C-6 dehydrogenase TviB, partial [Proteobacteria bacterium]|nr:Vi polysaccharide biosynthesis UDP-N-acetylglucosamine C-6 dehydrogenase TviB [Pseudomonadota bacterium]